MASRLRALGGHVTQHMRCALHLGVQKALGVVVSHYRVNLEAISTAYVIPVGVDDEVEMNRVDTLAAPAVDMLAEDFMEFLFPDVPGLAALKLENNWAFVLFMLAFKPRDYVINICCLKHLNVCKLKQLSFISTVVLFCLPYFLG
jgi:hypothetical protein